MNRKHFKNTTSIALPRKGDPIGSCLDRRFPFSMKIEQKAPSSMATPPVSESIEAPGPAPLAARTLFPILAAVSVCHLLNDMVQSLLPSIYPILKNTFKLDFSQVGLLSLTYQVVASLL